MIKITIMETIPIAIPIVALELVVSEDFVDKICEDSKIDVNWGFEENIKSGIIFAIWISFE